MTTAIALVVVAVITGLFTLAATLVTKRADRRAQAVIAGLETRKVDREEFDSITRELRAELDRMRTELATERRARAKSDERASAAELRAAHAEQRAADAERAGAAATRKLARRVAQLERAMRERDIPIPDPES